MAGQPIGTHNQHTVDRQTLPELVPRAIEPRGNCAWHHHSPRRGISAHSATPDLHL